MPQGKRSMTDIIEIVRGMDGTTLSIQGPPGAGKTFTAAHIIVALLDARKRIGVSANSHKAIVNLIRNVAEVAQKQNVPFVAVNIDDVTAAGFTPFGVQET